MNNNIEQLSEKQLLQLRASIIDELIKREVVRTKNNPLGDYTEWLVAKALNLQLARSSSAGYDGIDTTNSISIKSKVDVLHQTTNQVNVSAIRNYLGKTLIC